jgi:polyisoprenoid-binding protein YceI
MKYAMTLVLVVTAAIGASADDPVRFHVNDELRRDIVTFTSKAPLETVVGKTGEITGYIEVDPADISGTSSARLEVDLASLKTGIGLRDNHMRDQYLEVEKFPTAVFLLTEIKESGGNSLEHNVPVDLTLIGDFTVHGVTRQVEVTAKAVYLKETDDTKARLPGDLLHITATFDVYLTEHDIKRPQFVILKLDDLQKIDLDFFASTAVPPVETAGK